MRHQLRTPPFPALSHPPFYDLVSCRGPETPANGAKPKRRRTRWFPAGWRLVVLLGVLACAGVAPAQDRTHTYLNDRLSVQSAASPVQKRDILNRRLGARWALDGRASPLSSKEDERRPDALGQPSGRPLSSPTPTVRSSADDRNSCSPHTSCKTRSKRSGDPHQRGDAAPDHHHHPADRVGESHSAPLGGRRPHPQSVSRVSGHSARSGQELPCAGAAAHVVQYDDAPRTKTASARSKVLGRAHHPRRRRLLLSRRARPSAEGRRGGSREGAGRGRRESERGSDHLPPDRAPPRVASLSAP